MEPHDLLPKRVVNYIHDIGVRSLDHLADHEEKEEVSCHPEPPEPRGAKRTGAGRRRISRCASCDETASAKRKPRKSPRAFQPVT
jgi:hypothetical protein